MAKKKINWVLAGKKVGTTPYRDNEDFRCIIWTEMVEGVNTLKMKIKSGKMNESIIEEFTMDNPTTGDYGFLYNKTTGVATPMQFDPTSANQEIFVVKVCNVDVNTGVILQYVIGDIIGEPPTDSATPYYITRTHFKANRAAGETGFDLTVYTGTIFWLLRGSDEIVPGICPTATFTNAQVGYYVVAQGGNAITHKAAPDDTDIVICEVTALGDLIQYVLGDLFVNTSIGSGGVNGHFCITKNEDGTLKLNGGTIYSNNVAYTCADIDGIGAGTWGVVQTERGVYATTITLNPAANGDLLPLLIVDITSDDDWIELAMGDQYLGSANDDLNVIDFYAQESSGDFVINSGTLYIDKEAYLIPVYTTTYATIVDGSTWGLEWTSKNTVSGSIMLNPADNTFGPAIRICSLNNDIISQYHIGSQWISTKAHINDTHFKAEIFNGDLLIMNGILYFGDSEYGVNNYNAPVADGEYGVEMTDVGPSSTIIKDPTDTDYGPAVIICSVVSGEIIQYILGDVGIDACLVKCVLTGTSGTLNEKLMSHPDIAGDPVLRPFVIAEDIQYVRGICDAYTYTSATPAKWDSVFYGAENDTDPDLLIKYIYSLSSQEPINDQMFILNDLGTDLLGVMLRGLETHPEAVLDGYSLLHSTTEESVIFAGITDSDNGTAGVYPICEGMVGTAGGSLSLYSLGCGTSTFGNPIIKGINGAYPTGYLEFYNLAEKSTAIGECVLGGVDGNDIVFLGITDDVNAAPFSFITVTSDGDDILLSVDNVEVEVVTDVALSATELTFTKKKLWVLDEDTGTDITLTVTDCPEDGGT